ncbi:surface-adhesin E family protein [Stenoxybacter acetivorans]|uniref:surface-adhesin E family protein n=1 Tax=Stenoxybacter acetivorans TaxID=422441 RepID=UPI000561C585|nr:surface-adhesin E family protein [Stenoxybacter acetivorans]
MNRLHTHFTCFLSGIILLLSACAINPPTGSAEQWQHVGLSGDGNIQFAIDKNSIRRQKGIVYYRDKKTVTDVEKQSYTQTPIYKTAIGTWEMDCNRKTYRLTALTLLNNRGVSVGEYRYGSNDLRPMPIARDTVAEKQQQLLCK